MKVHLIRSANVQPQLAEDVMDILQVVPGPLKFVAQPNHYIEFSPDEFRNDKTERREFEKKKIFEPYSLLKDALFPISRPVASWQTIFGKCEKYRQKRTIPEGEFVILLTDVANEQNWFSMLDEHHPWNGFIHTADWEYFLDANPVYPIAYMVVSKVIQKHMFGSMKELSEAMHHRPMGCINDFCQDKKEIILKLRTADICFECFKRIQGRIDPVLLQQCMSILDNLRVKMLYSQNFRQRMPASRMLIRRDSSIILPDYQEMEIRLRPLEKALYFLYLKHPSGILLTHLVDHKEELREIYGNLTTRGLLADIYNNVDGLVNVNSNSASEKISRIKSEFESKVGLKLSRPYFIQGGNGEPKNISLDRTLVDWEH